MEVWVGIRVRVMLAVTRVVMEEETEGLEPR